MKKHSTPYKNRIISGVGILLMFTAFVFVSKVLLEFKIEWHSFLDLRNILLLFLSITSMICSIFILSNIWKSILSFISQKNVETRTAFNTYAKSNLGKYLPGNVGHYAGRQLFGASLGLKQSQLALASVLEILYTAFAALLLSIMLAWGKIFEVVKELFPRVNIPILFMIVLAFGMAALVMLYTVFRKRDFLLEFLIQIKTGAFWSLLLKATVVSMLFLFIIGLIFAFFINAVTPVKISEYHIIIAASVTSWLIGFVIPGVPGGIGVREAVLSLILSPIFPMEIVLAAGIIQRVSFIVGEILAWIISAAFCKGVI